MAEIPDFTEAAGQNAAALFDAQWERAMQQDDLKSLAPAKQLCGQMYIQGYRDGVRDSTLAFMSLKETE